VIAMVVAHLTNRSRLRLRKLRFDERGAYMVELAFVMPVFLLTMIGAFDLASQAYYRATLNGAVEFASRLNTVETTQGDPDAVDDIVRARVGDVARFANLSFTRRNYDNFTDVDQPEDYSDTNGNGVRNPGECFTDVNNNGSYDTNRGANGQGSGGDIVIYEVTMTYNRLFPLWRMLGQPQQAQIRSRGVLRTQPFSVQSTTSQVICT
jgi:hypothetical protein